MRGGHFFDGERRVRTGVRFDLRDVAEIDRVVVDHQARDVVVAAHRIHVRRRNRRIACGAGGTGGGRIAEAVTINARDDGFRDGHRAGGSFVADAVAIFGDAGSHNPPPVLEHDGIGGRRRHDQQDKRRNGRCVTHTQILQARQATRARSFGADALSSTACPTEQGARGDQATICPRPASNNKDRGQCPNLRASKSRGRRGCRAQPGRAAERAPKQASAKKGGGKRPHSEMAWAGEIGQ